MYININNPNDFIRTILLKQFNKLDVSNIEDTIFIVESFQYLDTFHHEIYRFVLSIMYQDYFIEKKFAGKRYKLFKELSDICEYISIEPFFIVEMLQEVFSFSKRSLLNKKEMFSKAKKYYEYLFSINNLYIFDMLNYGRDYVKEDLLCCYYEEYEKYNDLDEQDKEFYASDVTEDFLNELYNTDTKNYYSLARQILEEGYYYLKNEALIGKLRDDESELINYIEKNTFYTLIEFLVTDEFLFSDIFYYLLSIINYRNQNN